MVEQPRSATVPGRPTGRRSALLTRIQDEITTSPGAGTRRCPCCGGPIRAGQRVTSIYGTSVHVRCASGREAARNVGR